MAMAGAIAVKYKGLIAFLHGHVLYYFLCLFIKAFMLFYGFIDNFINSDLFTSTGRFEEAES